MLITSTKEDGEAGDAADWELMLAMFCDLGFVGQVGDASKRSRSREEMQEQVG